MSDTWIIPIGASSTAVVQNGLIPAPLSADGMLLTRTAGVLAGITRAQLATDAAFVNFPRGTMAAHSLQTAFTTSGTHTTYQDEGLTVTCDDTINRRLKITLALNLYVVAANSIVLQMLRDGVSLRQWYLPSDVLPLATGVLGAAVTLTYEEVVAATHAASVYKVQIKAGTSNTSVTSYGAGGGFPRQLTIEDMGI